MCRAPVGSPSCGSMVPLFIFPLWVFLHDWFPRRWPRLVPPSPAPIGSPVTKFHFQIHNAARSPPTLFTHSVGDSVSVSTFLIMSSLP